MTEETEYINVYGARVHNLKISMRKFPVTVLPLLRD